MKHTYSSGKSSCSKVAATIYGRDMGLSFCKKFTYRKKQGNQIVIEKRKKDDAYAYQI